MTVFPPPVSSFSLCVCVCVCCDCCHCFFFLSFLASIQKGLSEKALKENERKQKKKKTIVKINSAALEEYLRELSEGYCKKEIGRKKKHTAFRPTSSLSSPRSHSRIFSHSKSASKEKEKGREDHRWDIYIYKGKQEKGKTHMKQKKDHSSL